MKKVKNLIASILLIAALTVGFGTAVDNHSTVDQATSTELQWSGGEDPEPRPGG